MEKQTERQKKTTVPVATSTNLPASPSAETTWGLEDITQSDLVLPRILLTQFMSELVTTEVAKAGEFRDSLETSKLLGDVKNPIEIIVFGTSKAWIVFKDGEFLNMEARTAANDKLPLKETLEDGSFIERKGVLNVNCLLTSDMKKGEAFPYVVSFKGMSTGAGKKLITQLMKLQMFGKPIAAKTFKIKAQLEENDKGKYYVMDVDMGRDTTVEESQAAQTWFRMLQTKKNVTVDNVGVE